MWCHIRVWTQKVVSLCVLGPVRGYMCAGWVWLGLWHWVLSVLPDSMVCQNQYHLPMALGALGTRLGPLVWGQG